MRSNSLSQTDLARKVGIVQSTISAVLNGRRKLTKNQVVKLAEFFNVAPAAFLPSRATGKQNGLPEGSGRTTSRIAAASHPDR